MKLNVSNIMSNMNTYEHVNINYESSLMVCVNSEYLHTASTFHIPTHTFPSSVIPTLHEYISFYLGNSNSHTIFGKKITKTENNASG